MKPAPKIPKTPWNVELGKIKSGRLVEHRPRGGKSDCPYCGRDNPIDGGYSGAVGFRIAGWSKHLFHCYEQALLRQGWVIGNYNERLRANVLAPLKPENVRAMSKMLKVPLKDIPVKPAPHSKATQVVKAPKPERVYCIKEVRDPQGIMSNCKNVARPGTDYCHVHSKPAVPATFPIVNPFPYNDGGSLHG